MRRQLCRMQWMRWWMLQLDPDEVKKMIENMYGK